jgi:hypothetical protein
MNFCFSFNGAAFFCFNFNGAVMKTQRPLKRTSPGTNTSVPWPASFFLLHFKKICVAHQPKPD